MGLVDANDGTNRAIPSNAKAIDVTDEWKALGDKRTEELAHHLDEPPKGMALVLATSDFVYNELGRQDDLLSRWLAEDALNSTRTYEKYVQRIYKLVATAANEAALMSALRRLRRAEMARIAWRDIAALAPFTTIATESSALADAIINAALEYVQTALEVHYGTPYNARDKRQKMVVFALGKLGASELNFSSDIDLIYAFEDGGTTRGAREVDHDEFYTRVARRLIKVLGEVNQEGLVYRVDMRLRPFGSQGPMASSFQALEHYYQTHGRDWERYAWIRARVVAGDHDAGVTFLEMLRPFIYRRYLDFSALGSLREMKSMINAEVRRGGLEDNIKTGLGGIREVEFLAQAFQLVRGGRLPALRGREVIPVLERLAEYELLPEFATRSLADAYRFMRTLEHRLQQVEDQQVHTLPKGERDRARIALSLGFDTWGALEEELEQNRRLVHSHFDQVFGLDDEERDEIQEPLATLTDPEIRAEDALGALTEAGFGEAATRAFELITRLTGNLRIRSLGERGRTHFNRLLPQLIQAAAGTPEPETTLSRLVDVMLTIAPRSTYLALLRERPLALSQLVQLCAASPMIAQHIRFYPLVIDELLDPRTLYAPLRKEGLRAELELRLQAVDAGDLEQEMETLRREKQTNVLRVAAADVAGALPLMIVSDHLSDIAEVCVERALKITWRDLVARHGPPRYVSEEQPHDAGFAIIGYGKLGGLELGYGSDLDLVYLHGSRGKRQLTAGPREVDNQLFFARLAQRLGHMISTHTPAGVLYDLDIRLRPNGAKGLPVVSIEGFTQYQREEAWTWEHQALVRARFICGDPALREEFEAIRAEILLRKRDADALREEVRQMRERMRMHLGSKQTDRFDLKQDRGGIADIEFIVQYLVLNHAAALGSYLVYTDNIRLLDGVAEAGILPAADVTSLADSYRAFRARGHELALQDVPAELEPQAFASERAAVSALWARIMESSA